MAQKIHYGVKQMVAEARAEINELTVDEAIKLQGNDDVVIVDIRDIRERQREGYIPGAFHCPRGMLEFWLDPVSPYHKDVFAQDKHFVFHCAAGWRSALAAQVAQKMGLKPVSHIEGGFAAWVEAKGPIEKQD